MYLPTPTYHAEGQTTKFCKKFEVYCMNMLLSSPQHLRVNYFANSVTAFKVKSDKRFMVEANRRSAKHQWDSFYETENSQMF